METLNFVQVQLKPRSNPLKIAQIRSKSLKIAYFGPSRRVQEASSAFSRNFCRLGWTNISTLLPTVSGVLVNIQHQQLVECKTTVPEVLSGRTLARLLRICARAHFSSFAPETPNFSNKGGPGHVAQKIHQMISKLCHRL